MLRTFEQVRASQSKNPTWLEKAFDDMKKQVYKRSLDCEACRDMLESHTQALCSECYKLYKSQGVPGLAVIPGPDMGGPGKIDLI